MRYTVWSSPVSHLYTTSLVSRATIFHIVMTTLTLVPPLLMAYRSQGFWMRTATYREQPDIHFRHELVLVADTASGSQVGWSTFTAVNTFLVDKVRIPAITSREEDTNRDGLLDRLDIQVKMPVQPGEEVVRVSLLLVFHAELTKFSLVTMEGLASVEAGGWPGSGLEVTADLGIRLTQPLSHRGRDTRYAGAPIPHDSEDPEDFNIARLMRDYAERNVSLRLENSHNHWTPGKGSRFFTINARSGHFYKVFERFCS